MNDLVTVPVAEVPEFLRVLADGGGEAAIKRWGSDEHVQAGRPTVRDPRGFGVKGAYPRTGPKVNAALLDRLQEEVGVFGAVVDEWASNTWSEAWALQSAKDPKWAELATSVLLDYDVPGILEDADRNVLVHGKGLVLFRLDDAATNADLVKAPKRGAELQDVVDVPIPLIAGPDRHETGPLRGTLKAIRIKFGREGVVAVHPDRLLVVRQSPILDDPLEGKAFLKRTVDDVVLFENNKWSGGETYARRASPMIQVKLDPEMKLNEKSMDAMKAKLDDLVSGVTQRAVVKGYEFKAIEGWSGALDPKPYWEMGLDSVSLSSRVPKHILAGSAAGELASAQEDTRRFYARVGRRQERYGTKTVRSVVMRFVGFGLIPEPPEDWEVKWHPLFETPELEKFGAFKAQGEAIQAFRIAKAGVPVDLVDYKAAEVPEDPSAPDDPPPPPGVPPAPGQPPEEAPEEGPEAFDACCDGRDSPATLPEDEDLKLVRLRNQAKIQAAFQAWLEEYERPMARDPRGAQQGARLDPSDPLVRKLLRVTPDPVPMRKAVMDLLQDAALAGGASFQRTHPKPETGRRTPSQGDAEEDPFEFVDDTPIRTFRVLAVELSRKEAQMVATRIRSSIAQGMAAGEGLRQLRARVIQEFDFAPRQAETIARTESARGWNLGRREAIRQAGAARFQFNSLGEACTICAPLDGKAFDLDDSDHVPPMHPQCRCSITIVPEDVT